MACIIARTQERDETEDAMPGNADAFISNIMRGSAYNGGPARRQAEENRTMTGDPFCRRCSLANTCPDDFP